MWIYMIENRCARLLARGCTDRARHGVVVVVVEGRMLFLQPAAAQGKERRVRSESG